MGNGGLRSVKGFGIACRLGGVELLCGSRSWFASCHLDSISTDLPKEKSRALLIMRDLPFCSDE